MLRTKDMYDDVGEVTKIDISGLAVFDMPLLGKDGKQKKGQTEEMKLAVKCQKGDRVVKLKGKPRPFLVIPAKEWADMPVDEESYKAQIAADATPQLAEIAQRLNALEAENAALKAQNKAQGNGGNE